MSRDRPRERHRGRRDAAEPIWSRPEPGARRPRHTREEIAQAALRIADEEGFEAVSMRRIARELGSGTMSLYHYLRTRDDLLALMDDAMMGELLVPDGELPTDDWRGALTEIARRTRDVWVRHPWALEALRGARFGPNGMRHVEQSLAAVSSMDVDPAVRLEVIGIVDDHVLGFCVRESALRAPAGGPDPMEAILDYVTERLSTGDFPYMQALVGDNDVRETWRRLSAETLRSDRFEVGLSRLLDGIELDLERRKERGGG